MAKSLGKVLDSNIAKKVAEKREREAAKRQLDCDKLLSLLEDKFKQLLTDAIEFDGSLFIPDEEVCQLYNTNLSDWVEDLGFSVEAEKRYPKSQFTLTIPEFTSGEGKKMTIAQKRLKAFNAALKARKKQLRADAEALCKELTQKIIDGEGRLDADEKTLTVYHTRPGSNILTNYEVAYMTNFFAKRKVQFEASSILGTYRFYR